jgi:hypothetical protein
MPAVCAPVPSDKRKLKWRSSLRKSAISAILDRSFAGFPRVFCTFAREVSQIVEKVTGEGWFLARRQSEAHLMNRMAEFGENSPNEANLDESLSIT